ncbi:enolase C-terminal domain-like protein [Denitrobaculum tricleocarpae]|uniref:Mandelate racemase n=1 Tax=Denitrobaculum tricleocarpae TaxID=2591009 RepID=A0A545TG29_9PROT|nr:enolase C-terminal domain-like protein [Denitrobaculum tricleocarpae]TQV76177.1 mandelate racemase [Denitrobaculum tricleocarpae]
MTDIPTVTGLKSRAVIAPLQRPVRTAVGTLPNAPLVLIDVETDLGVTGQAYVFGYTPVTLKAIVAFLSELEESLIGQSVAPVEQARFYENRFRLLGRQGLVGMALSCLDMALWDALGKAAGLPVVNLLGGRARPIQAYDSYGVVDPKEDREDLERSLERGFRAIKIKIGDGDLVRDIAMVSGVREIIGPDVELMVDFNQSRSVPDAVHRIEALSEYNLAWVEEPVPAEDFVGHAEVRAASTPPIQTGENWWFPQDMAKAIDAGACDCAMPDLMKIGGITAWLRAAGIAEANAIPVSSHLFVEASAHVLPVTPTAHYLEFLDIAGSVLQEPMEVKDGHVTARGPGLGMTWDEDAVARFTA